MSGRARTNPALCVLLAAGLAGGGCWTSQEEGEALRRDIEKMKVDLSKKIEDSQKERAKLQKVMEQATALLTRNSADVGAQVERIQARQAKLGGQMDEALQALKALQAAFGDVKGKVEVLFERQSSATGGGGPITVPKDKDELFKLAQNKFNAAAHKEARYLLTQYEKQYPNDPRTPEVMLMLGNSYFAEQKYMPAVLKYRGVLKHPTSPQYAEALFKTGMAFYQEKFCKEADGFLKLFLAKFPRQVDAKRAKKVRKLIRRYRRNKDFCK